MLYCGIRETVAPSVALISALSMARLRATIKGAFWQLGRHQTTPRRAHLCYCLLVLATVLLWPPLVLKAPLSFALLFSLQLHPSLYRPTSSPTPRLSLTRPPTMVSLSWIALSLISAPLFASASRHNEGTRMLRHRKVISHSGLNNTITNAKRAYGKYKISDQYAGSNFFKYVFTRFWIDDVKAKFLVAPGTFSTIPIRQMEMSIISQRQTPSRRSSRMSRAMVLSS